MPLPIVFLNIPYRYPHFILCTAYRVTDVIYSIQRKVHSFGLLIWWRYFFPPKESPFVQHFAMITFLFFPPRKKTVQQCTAMTLLFSPKLNSFRSAFCHDDVTALLQQKAQWFDIMPWWRYLRLPMENLSVSIIPCRRYFLLPKESPLVQHYTTITLLSPSKRKPIRSA